jgi:hypothetical protein
MFHWICPECGREIAPTVRECPACEGADTAELVLAGVVEASARTSSAGDSGARMPAPIVEREMAAEPAADRQQSGFPQADQESVARPWSETEAALQSLDSVLKADSDTELKSVPSVNEPEAAENFAAAEPASAAPETSEPALIPEILDTQTAIERKVEAKASDFAAALGDEPVARSVRSKTVESRAVQVRAVEAKPVESRVVEPQPAVTKPVPTRAVADHRVEPKVAQPKTTESGGTQAAARIPLIRQLTRLILPPAPAPVPTSGTPSQSDPVAATAGSEGRNEIAAAAPVGQPEAPITTGPEAVQRVSEPEAARLPEPSCSEAPQVADSLVEPAPPSAEPPDPPLSAKLPLPVKPAAAAPTTAVGFAAEQKHTADECAGVAAEGASAQAGETLVANSAARFARRIQIPISEPAPAEEQKPLSQPAPVRMKEALPQLAPIAPRAGAVRAPRTQAPRAVPRTARLVRYSPAAKRAMCPAPPPEGLRKSPPTPGTTLPGPMLTRSLVSFRDKELAPNFVEEKAFRKRFAYGWLILVLLVGTALGVGFSSFLSNMPHPEAKTPEEQGSSVSANAASLHGASSSPLSKSIEVTGIRMITDPSRKEEVQYLVVNHSPARFSDGSVYVTVRAADARPGQPPLFRFSFAAPNLGPFEAKEMVSAVEKTSRAASLPDWQNLRVQIEIGQ